MPGVVEGANGSVQNHGSKLTKNQMRRAKKKADKRSVSLAFAAVPVLRFTY